MDDLYSQKSVVISINTKHLWEKQTVDIVFLGFPPMLVYHIVRPSTRYGVLT